MDGFVEGNCRWHLRTTAPRPRPATFVATLARYSTFTSPVEGGKYGRIERKCCGTTATLLVGGSDWNLCFLRVASGCPSWMDDTTALARCRENKGGIQWRENSATPVVHLQNLRQLSQPRLHLRQACIFTHIWKSTVAQSARH